jgi:hypothetical protein
MYDPAEPRERVAAKAVQRIVALDLQRIDPGAAGGYGRRSRIDQLCMLLDGIDRTKTGRIDVEDHRRCARDRTTQPRGCCATELVASSAMSFDHVAALRLLHCWIYGQPEYGSNQFSLTTFICGQARQASAVLCR